MKKYYQGFITLVLAITGLIILPGNSANAWEYSVGEEDWGSTCYASQPHTNGNVTLLTAEGSFAPIMLISLPRYPRDANFPVSLVFDNGNNYQLDATVDDYFGNVYINIDASIIENMKQGNNLNIVVQNRFRVNLSLRNSSNSLNSFLGCAQPPVNSTQPTATGQWTALNDIGPGWQPGPNAVDEIQYRISERGYVELRGRLYMKNVRRANRQGGNKIYRVLLQLPTLNGQQYVFNHHDNVRTERLGVAYGQAHRMEISVFDSQITFPHTEVQNPSSGELDSVTLYGLKIPIE